MGTRLRRHFNRNCLPRYGNPFGHCPLGAGAWRSHSREPRLDVRLDRGRENRRALGRKALPSAPTAERSGNLFAGAWWPLACRCPWSAVGGPSVLTRQAVLGRGSLVEARLSRHRPNNQSANNSQPRPRHRGDCSVVVLTEVTRAAIFIYLELPKSLELSTSSIPMRCSTN